MYDFPECVTVTHELLKIWRARHGNDDTGMVDELCRVLKEAGRTDLGKYIGQRLVGISDAT